MKPSKHLKIWCAIVQKFPRTSLKSARLHLKTTVALGYLAWKILRMIRGRERKYNEWLYLCFKEEGAEYQIKRLKRYIRELPELFGDLIELTDAETKVVYGYSDDGGTSQSVFVVEPAGMFSFKRGQHPDGIIADDILRDPQVKLDISQLEKLERIFIEEIEPMPKEELHVFGTSQDENDLFKKLEGMKSYYCREFPAILNEADKRVLWPEQYSFDTLVAMRTDWGNKAFNKEMMCRPVRGEEGYIRPEVLDALTCSRLKNYAVNVIVRLNEWTFGGFDIGKKSHPSHLFVLGVDRRKRLVQIHSRWMDAWNYVDQISYIREAIASFKMAKLLYDDTRAEFESMKESGILPAEMDGVAFTSKSKYGMATEVDALLSRKGILFLPDQRQRRQLLSVDNDLQAVQTREGHGDCFFSLCLAVRAYNEGQGLGVVEI